MSDPLHDAEFDRLRDDQVRNANWKRWGPYLSERQWGTVREDYSADGDSWGYFPHEHARSRAYRWGEDGLLGFTDRECRLCFAVALWNGNDSILKERLFGLTGPQGNHGEDVKEHYFYIDATPTHSYMKAMYRYPQAAYPYEKLVTESAKRSRTDGEYELHDTGVLNDSKYFEIFAEYAKAGTDDILIRLTIHNRAAKRATIHVLPTVWFRNTWSWGRAFEEGDGKPSLRKAGPNAIDLSHSTLGEFRFEIEPPAEPNACELLFTENETNTRLLFNTPGGKYTKDAFHDFVVRQHRSAVNPKGVGTKACAHCKLEIEGNSSVTIRARLFSSTAGKAEAFGRAFDSTFETRIREANAFYERVIPARLSEDERRVARQAYAGLLWTKQFYHYVVKDWLEGDPSQPPPPSARKKGRNRDWKHLFNRDVISMPDKWEYPWYAAWDLAFHMIPLCRIDPQFAKDQLLLFLREWYMHPNGQIPAYEFAFSDVNPPVHAWACWRVYKMTGTRGNRDRVFLARCFQKLMLNFTWWVNRKDADGKHIFGGGFLGLDNIGIFDRSKPLPGGGRLEQADGTAWMAFFCGTMLSMALELAKEDPVYEDVASKFFEHFVAIVDAINTLGGSGLWNDEDGFYYDQIHVDGASVPLRIRSLVGLLPIIASEVLEEDTINRLPGFKKRMDWFIKHQPDLSRHITYAPSGSREEGGHLLLAIPSKQRLERTLKYLLDESEFLSPYGIRSLSRYHLEKPFSLNLDGTELSVRYTPGESDTSLFGGNSNWRGPIWFPTSYLLIEAVERYDYFYGDSLRVECPTGSGKLMPLNEVALELKRRLASIFLCREKGQRPCHGGVPILDQDQCRDLILFHEYFNADTGCGLGASHQTGWTALVVNCLYRRTDIVKPAIPQKP